MLEDDIDKMKWLRTQPSHGPDWDAAIAYGIDVSLLEQSLALSYEARFAESLAMTRLALELEAAGKRLHAPAE